MCEYKIVRNNILPIDIVTIICEINDSKDFEIDDLSHIVLIGTNTRVGYVGDDTLELINPDSKSFSKYHIKLKEIC